MNYMIELRVFGIIVAILAYYMTYLNYKRKIFNHTEMAVWTLIWLAFIVIAFTPRSFDFLLQVFNLARTADLIMICAFIVIYMLCFLTYVNMRKLELKVEAVVRKVALENMDKPKAS